jgi:hypothetical protein
MGSRIAGFKTNCEINKKEVKNVHNGGGELILKCADSPTLFIAGSSYSYF